MSQNCYNFYCGTDVHAYTAALRQRSHEFSDFWKSPMTHKATQALLHDISVNFGNLITPGAHAMLQKLSSNLDLFDPDLGIFVAPVLFDCRKAVDACIDSAPLFFSILDEMNTTCVQGDTHRLLSFYFSLQ